MFEQYKKSPASINIASYVGHNTLRTTVMGENNKSVATEVEIEAMNSLLREELKAGAIGLSSGLEYEPGLYSTKDEILSLAKETAKVGG